MMDNKAIYIFGNGETSRTLSIDNVVQANILAAYSTKDRVFNIAFGDQILNQLFAKINKFSRIQFRICINHP